MIANENKVRVPLWFALFSLPSALEKNEAKTKNITKAGEEYKVMVKNDLDLPVARKYCIGSSEDLTSLLAFTHNF